MNSSHPEKQGSTDDRSQDRHAITELKKNWMKGFANLFRSELSTTDVHNATEQEFQALGCSLTDGYLANPHRPWMSIDDERGFEDLHEVLKFAVYFLGCEKEQAPEDNEISVRKLTKHAAFAYRKYVSASTVAEDAESVLEIAVQDVARATGHRFTDFSDSSLSS